MYDEAELWVQRRVGASLAPNAQGRLVEKITNFIALSVKEVGADRELRRLLDVSTREGSRAFLGSLVTESAEIVLPESAHELAQTIARKGLGLRVLMQINRMGQKGILNYLAEQSDDPAPTREASMRLWERASDWLNVSIEILADTYGRERELGLRSASARRVETVKEVLHGKVSDPSVLSNRIGYSPLGYNTALVLTMHSPPPGAADEAINIMEGVVRFVANAIGADHVLSVPDGSLGLWAWLSTGTPDYERPADTAAAEPYPSVRAALGNPAAGMEGFRSTFREALSAHNLWDRVRDRRRLLRFADIEVAHLLGGHPHAAATLVARELRGLDGVDANSAQLRQTLHCFLANHRSYDSAARDLVVHKNTVRYRIQRAEELLGHPIDSARLNLELALEYLDVLGDDVLGRSRPDRANY